MDDYNVLPNYEFDDLVPGGSVLPRAVAKTRGGMLTNNVQPSAGTTLPKTRRARLLQLQQDAAEVEGAEPDISQMQQYAQQRSGDGQTAMLNALAAQFAGESFQPVQAQYLKRAAAAQDPMKLGGGMLTADGQFLRDPFASQERKLGRLDRLITSEQSAIDAAERAEQARQDRLQREAEARRQDQRDYEMRVEGQNLRRSLADAGRSGREDQQAFQRSTTLRGEYSKKADKIAEGTRHAETVMTLLSDPRISQDPTKQVSLVFAFGKMLDPESVVRESEYALISNARGIFESLLQKPDQLLTGARLTPQQLQSMQQISSQLYAGSSQRRQDLAQYYRDIAKRNKLNEDDVLPPGVGGAAPTGGYSDAEKERRYQEWKKSQSGGKP